MKNKTISDIAGIIGFDWANPAPAAKPYLSAMYMIQDITDNYYQDSGKSIVSYFLANAGSWRGEVAREVKRELNRRLK